MKLGNFAYILWSVLAVLVTLYYEWCFTIDNNTLEQPNKNGKKKKAKAIFHFVTAIPSLLIIGFYVYSFIKAGFYDNSIGIIFFLLILIGSSSLSIASGILFLNGKHAKAYKVISILSYITFSFSLQILILAISIIGFLLGW